MARAVKYRGHMADVVDCCGIAVADALSSVLSGVNLYIPMALREDHLLEKLEPAMAEALIAAFGGSYIYVSKPQPERINPADIEVMVEKGNTIQEIALRLETTERHVLRLRADGGQVKIGSRPDPRQLSFFDS